jgi:hypothetical protein
MQKTNPGPHLEVDRGADQAVNAPNEEAPKGLLTTAVGGAPGRHSQSEGAPAKVRDPASGAVDSSVDQQTSIGDGQAKGEPPLML